MLLRGMKGAAEREAFACMSSSTSVRVRIGLWDVTSPFGDCLLALLTPSKPSESREAGERVLLDVPSAAARRGLASKDVRCCLLAAALVDWLKRPCKSEQPESARRVSPSGGPL